MSEDKLLTLEDLAKLFRVKNHTVHRWLAQGMLPPGIRINSRIRRWRRSMIEPLLDKSTPFRCPHCHRPYP